MTLSAETAARPPMEKLTNDNKDGALQLLSQVEKLANEGHNQKEIAKALGFKTTFTLNNRLVKASQITGKPVPKYKPNRQGKKELKRVELVEVKRRGKGSAFGVNVPQEPLMRAGLKPGDKLRVSVRGKTISLTR
jgi:hypothetical protein